MSNITKTNKTSRRRMVSSLKKFNKLLNAKGSTIHDHYLTKDECKHRLDSCLLDGWKQGHQVICSSKHGDMRRLNHHFEYVEKSLLAYSKDNPQEPDSVDDLLWVGGKAEEIGLARILGVTKVIIRHSYQLSWSWGSEIHHDVIKGESDDVLPTWVLVVDESTPKRTVRFDYVEYNDLREEEEVIFSRYFVSPDYLLNRVYLPFKREQDAERKRQDELKKNEAESLDTRAYRLEHKTEGLYARAQRLLSRSKLEAIDFTVDLPKTSEEVSND